MLNYNLKKKIYDGQFEALNKLSLSNCYFILKEFLNIYVIYVL